MLLKMRLAITTYGRRIVAAVGLGRVLQTQDDINVVTQDDLNIVFQDNTP